MSTFKNFLSDTAVLSGRMMRHNLRSIDTIITVVAMPVVMMLLTVYVFGGAMNTGGISYTNYVVPGIILMTIASGVAYAAFRLNNDVTAGIFDRFHSMPIAKSSILGGHVLSAVVFNAVSTVLVMLFAFLIGFRSDAGIVGWLLVIGFLLLCTLTLTWVAVLFGLLAKSAEGASVFSYFLLLLIFISPAFAPTGTMPGVIRAVAENQPFTSIVETVRALLLNQPAGNSALAAVLWCAGILLACYIASMRIYKHKIR
ncbi:ABC-2 type transport system permease protein [Sporobacter termitidis DSM 10068]|uniref:Transport permease protein n=1 Tax=Sporobacter termitidis DSM 10068 TaxID=1123282 RepID=A0A1M5YGC8_9FIRM|nr:ABC transporter permease [Sporobacter termitidis]SHI10908.1 ABC-2 type transport system permease protein [Sporobacter termitidis DSM 10068]